MAETLFHAPSKFDSWAVRNAHWLEQSTKPTAPKSRWARRVEPLILCGHGVSLRVEKDTLFIRNGATHYPQERESWRFFRGDRSNPPRILMLSGTGSISFDVLAWLSEQNISLIRLDYQGNVANVLAGSGSAFLPEKVNWQIETRGDTEKRIAFCCELIADKIANTLHTLKSTIPDGRPRTIARGIAEAAIRTLNDREVGSVNDILMIEARAAGAYFNSWRSLPIRWKAKKEFPIPPRWTSHQMRRSYSLRNASTNRHASHPVNAMLNYGYAVLHSKVQAETVADGYDPARGIMHEGRPDCAALILDFMEPRRPLVDAAILKFVANNVFSAADFTINDDGVCRLVPQLARRIASLV